MPLYHEGQRTIGPTQARVCTERAYEAEAISAPIC
jgi:hypothetical protein